MIDLIQRIGERLQSSAYVNEAAITHGIVTPILQELGWDTADPHQVIPEFANARGRVDFALIGLGKRPAIFIEVKQVGRAIDGDRQLFEYAFHQGVPLCVLTDGREWSFYLPGGQGSYDDRRVYRLQLDDRSPAESQQILSRYLQRQRVLDQSAWYCQLDRRGSRSSPRRPNSGGSVERGIPLGEGRRAEGSQGLARDEVALEVEGIVDRGMGGDETLSLALGLEPLHLPFASSDREMRVLRPVVVAQSPWIVAIEAAQCPERRRVRFQPVGDKAVRRKTLVLQQFPEQFQCCRFVPALLHQHVEHFALGIDRTPHVHAHAIDPHHHLVEVPDTVGARPAAANVGGDGGAKLYRPAPDRLVADLDAALGEHLLDVAQRQREAEVEPHCEPDHVRWKAVPFVRDRAHRRAIPSSTGAAKRTPPEVALTWPAEYIEARKMSHVRGAPMHPQTQGKIERWHQTLKNRILLENYFLPGDLEAQIEAFVEHYNNQRYHESLINVTPADAYFGRASAMTPRAVNEAPGQWRGLIVSGKAVHDRLRVNSGPR